MYEAHIWYRVSRNPCHTRQAHQTWLRPRQKIKICCSIVCSRNLQCACNNNKNGAEQQDLGQISATHRHEDARCVPVELLMCKVVITKWGLPACRMECTYSACVTLFASICSTDIVKPNDYSRRHKKNAMSRKSPLKYVAFHLQHVALRSSNGGNHFQCFALRSPGTTLFSSCVCVGLCLETGIDLSILLFVVCVLFMLLQKSILLYILLFC